MKNVDILGRIYASLVLAILACIVVFTQYVFTTNEVLHAQVDYYEALSSDDQQLLLLLARERLAAQLYQMARYPSALRSFEAAQVEFSHIMVREFADAPAEDRTDNATVDALHSQYTDFARNLMDRGKSPTAVDGRAMLAAYFGAYSHTESLLQRMYSARQARAASVHDRYDRRQHTLQWAIIVTGIIGILVVSALLYTKVLYRRKADAALREKIDRLERTALTDSLTQLGNHRAFYEEFPREVQHAGNRMLNLVLIDVDDFKSVNDTHGHKHGDDVLVRLAASLKLQFPKEGIYRLGGDELALVVAGSTGAELTFTLRRLQEDLRATLLGATVSIGYANLAPTENDRDLYERADAALYEAKRAGRNRIVSFEEIRTTAYVFSANKVNAVRRIIERGSVNVAFQPIWDIAGGSILGFEALARPHPESSLSGPQEAFDIAERINKMPQLDATCLRATLAGASQLPKNTLLFVNLSPETLEHSSFSVDRLRRQIVAAGLLPSQIVVEFTERRVSQPEVLVQRANELKSAGLRVALDDTGSGYAGLEMLSAMPVDFIKIDRSLLLRAREHRAARGVLAGIIAIARATDAYVIAEGIESIDLLEFARNAHEPHERSFSAGIRGAQGYLLGEPLIGNLDPESFQVYARYVKLSLYRAS